MKINYKFITPLLLIIALLNGCDFFSGEKSESGKTDDWSFTGDIDDPEPVVSAVDQQLLELASEKAKSGKSLSTDEAEVILKQVSYVFRSWRGDLGVDDVSGWCGPARDLAVYTLMFYGIDEDDIYPQATDRIFISKFVHQFLVVDMPDSRTYLVDTTYRQFFDDFTDKEHPGKNDWIPTDDMNGYYDFSDPFAVEEYWMYNLVYFMDCICTLMRSDRIHSETADHILKYGFTEVDDETMNCYGEGFAGGAEDKTYSVADMRNKKTGSMRSKESLLSRLNEKSVEENFIPDEDAQAVIEAILTD